MNLVDEYLRAVAMQLPKAQRDDITAELRDVILSTIEAREEKQGRPLSDDETEGVLREIGHPLVVAARYRGGPQHAVGPALYPYWLFAVKVMITVQLAIAALVFLVNGLIGGDMSHAFSRMLGSAFGGLATLVGIATIAAWMIERYGLRVDYLENWRVRNLRGLEIAAWDFDAWRERLAPVGRAARRSAGAAPRAVYASRPAARAGGALALIATSTVFIMWWIDALHFSLIRDTGHWREVGIEPGALAGLDWIALKAQLFWPVLALALGGVVRGLLMLARPNAMRLHGVVALAIGVLELALAAWVWTASPLSSAIQVQSVAEFIMRLSMMFGSRPWIDLPSLLMLIVALGAFGGLCRVLRGLWMLITALPAGRSGMMALS